MNKAAGGQTLYRKQNNTKRSLMIENEGSAYDFKWIQTGKRPNRAWKNYIHETPPFRFPFLQKYGKSPTLELSNRRGEIVSAVQMLKANKTNTKLHDFSYAWLLQIYHRPKTRCSRQENKNVTSRRQSIRVVLTLNSVLTRRTLYPLCHCSKPFEVMSK